MSRQSLLSARLPSMLAGCQSALPPSVSILIAGQSAAQPAIVSTLQGYAALDAKVAAAKLTYDQAIKARDDVAATVATYLDDLAVGLKAYYGATNPTLASFGVPVKHPPAKLPADKLVMKAARAKGTRELRGTKGKNQKKDIKAVIPATPPPEATALTRPPTSKS